MPSISISLQMKVYKRGIGGTLFSKDIFAHTVYQGTSKPVMAYRADTPSEEECLLCVFFQEGVRHPDAQ